MPRGGSAGNSEVAAAAATTRRFTWAAVSHGRWARRVLVEEGAPRARAGRPAEVPPGVGAMPAPPPEADPAQPRDVSEMAELGGEQPPAQEDRLLCIAEDLFAREPPPTDQGVVWTTAEGFRVWQEIDPSVPSSLAACQVTKSAWRRGSADAVIWHRPYCVEPRWFLRGTHAFNRVANLGRQCSHSVTTDEFGRDRGQGQAVLIAMGSSHAPTLASAEMANGKVQRQEARHHSAANLLENLPCPPPRPQQYSLVTRYAYRLVTRYKSKCWKRGCLPWYSGEQSCPQS